MRKLRYVLAALAATTVGGCAASTLIEEVKGPPVQNTTTPYDKALTCLKLALPKAPITSVAIGQVADRTGKFNYDEGSGYWITQGAGDILSSAMFRAGPVRLVERLDTRILEWELDLANKRVLGDGTSRLVKDKDGYDRAVEYRGIREGGVMGSSYYIVGSINTLDLAVNSIGGSVGVSGIGPRARSFSMRVGLDLRMVETTTGAVVAATSLNKRLVGDEIGAGIGRFFGTTLVEFDIGMKRNEPLHMALRSMLNLAAFNLLSQMYNMPANTCTQGITKLEGVEDVAAKPAAKTTLVEPKKPIEVKLEKKPASK